MAQSSAESVPLVLVPGLTCTAQLYAPQIVALWRYGPVTVADHRRDADIKAIAARILKDAPPRFALLGLSFGGYIAFEMMRQAPTRIVKFALLDTAARPDTPEQSAGRKVQIEMAQTGRYGEIADLAIPRYLHRNRQNDPAMTGIVRQMIDETGPEAFVRQLQAIMSRPDSRPLLAGIACPTLVLVGDGDLATPPELNKEIADGIPGARYVVVPDCGHLSTVERPEAVNAALAQWLEA
jgi:pimeloyl-ACP methyl ester carboxylesterase